nr:citrate:proton symporter [Altericroceibacterium indicum]
MAIILTNRVSPLAALILVPVIGATIAGLGPAVPEYIVTGLTNIAPVAGMFVFAILFFGVMTDAGLLAPIVNRILKLVGERPSRITVGTALLALIIHLDGSGAVCFLITIPALRPLYDRLGMDRRILACTASMAAGVNFLPWTGPTLRASASLDIPVYEIFTPMIGVQLTGLVFVFAASWWLGKREEKRLGLSNHSAATTSAGSTGLPQSSVQSQTIPVMEEDAETIALRRPKLYWVNVLLTLVVVSLMISGLMEPAVVFMVGTAVALVINYPSASQQRQRIDAHARAALLMAAILFGAGAFTGIMTGSGMIRAMAEASVAHVPDPVGANIPVFLGFLSMPLSLLFDPDSFYFGVLPVIAQVGSHFDVPAVQVAQAALLGQMTTGFPISPLTPATFLVAGLSGIELGAHQRFSIPWLFAASVIMTLAAIAFGIFTI